MYLFFIYVLIYLFTSFQGVAQLTGNRRRLFGVACALGRDVHNFEHRTNWPIQCRRSSGDHIFYFRKCLKYAPAEVKILLIIKMRTSKGDYPALERLSRADKEIGVSRYFVNMHVIIRCLINLLFDTRFGCIKDLTCFVSFCTL